MIDKVNTIRNPRFGDGKSAPRGWTFKSADETATWERPIDGSGITLSAASTATEAHWSQTVSCEPDAYYRVEAAVSCDLQADATVGGFILSVQPAADAESAGERRATPGLWQTKGKTTVRATFKAPDAVRRVRVSVGVTSARGTVTIYEVRFIPVLEPDEESHVLGLPVPPFRLAASRKVDRICVCSETADERPVTCLLKSCFSDRKVQTATPKDWLLQGSSADAVLFPDAAPPRAIRSLKGLFDVASERVVVMSLPAFARLSRGALEVRRITQDDDPTFAKVVYADFATQGFALQDTFAFSWPGRREGSHVQQQYRKTNEFDAFLKRHGLDILLVSMCDKDATSNRPMALFKRTAKGALYVFDIEPVETDGTTLDEPVVAMHVLLSMLGRLQGALGQYVVPYEKEAGFRLAIRELPARFQHVSVHEEDVPIDEVHEQLVTIGGSDETFGLPLQPKPVILVRSGLLGGDMASAYGALMWFKQLIRMEPHVCAYAEALVTQFRLAWIPAAAPWEAPEGWRPTGRPPERDWLLETDGGQLAALIDLVSVAAYEARLIVPTLEGDYARLAAWMPQLTKSFAPGQYFAPCPSDGGVFADRSDRAWRHVQLPVTVHEDRKRFMSAAHSAVLEDGGQCFIIEIPDDGASFTAHSIQRTDLAATLLEHVVGLVYGLIAVNRTRVPVTLNGFSPVAPGEALVVDRQNSMIHPGAACVG